MQLIIKQQTGKKDDQRPSKYCAVFVHCTHNCKFDIR